MAKTQMFTPPSLSKKRTRDVNVNEEKGGINNGNQERLIVPDSVGLPDQLGYGLNGMDLQLDSRSQQYTYKRTLSWSFS